MPIVKRVTDQMNERIRRLVEAGLADRVQFGFPRPAGKRVDVTFPNAAHVSTALKNVKYSDVYRLFVRERVYNVKMLDGALIQMTYEFAGGRLRRHRLAFLPAPHLHEFQNSPDVYLHDELQIRRSRRRQPLRGGGVELGYGLGRVVFPPAAEGDDGARAQPAERLPDDVAGSVDARTIRSMNRSGFWLPCRLRNLYFMPLRDP